MDDVELQCVDNNVLVHPFGNLYVLLPEGCDMTGPVDMIDPDTVTMRLVVGADVFASNLDKFEGIDASKIITTRKGSVNIPKLLHRAINTGRIATLIGGTVLSVGGSGDDSVISCTYTGNDVRLANMLDGSIAATTLSGAPIDVDEFVKEFAVSSEDTYTDMATFIKTLDIGGPATEPVVAE